MLLAHLSDLHLDGTEQAAARARAAVDRVHAAGDAVDALLVTGDLADHGAESEYEEVAAVLAGLPFPVLTCPGNHDERRAYRKVLRDGATGDGPIDELHVLRRDGAPALAVLMCDSSIPGAGAGALSPETLAWIDTSLTALPDEVPAVLAFHHPPARLHHPLPDGLRLTRPDDLADLLARHPRVLALLTGHAHTAAATSFAGIALRSAPAVTYTLRLTWEGEGHADDTQPPGLAYHVLAPGERHVTTHFRVAA
ncbi:MULTISPECIES: metallophosphoesterase [unclassified Streptomyces]|uniref:metallophosphoesterase n=1 Tax=unclassified Streptomyces TaxID=2593676 RepID=UPI003455517B